MTLHADYCAMCLQHVEIGRLPLCGKKETGRLRAPLKGRRVFLYIPPAQYTLYSIRQRYLSLLPGLESEFVLFELVAPVGVDLLVVRCLVRRTASVITENKNISIQFRNFEKKKNQPHHQTQLNQQ